MTPAPAGAAAVRAAAPAVRRLAAPALRVAALLGRRLALLTVLLAVVFAAVELLPGDAASATSDRGEGAAGVARRRHLLGLDRPVAERFLDWITALPTGDLGTSARGTPVTGLLSAPFPNTLLLGGTAFVLTVLLSLALGCWAAARPGGTVDRIVDLTSTAAFALPEFVVSIGLLLVFSLGTGWLPAATLTGADGSPSDASMLVMPVLALAVPQTGWNTRVVRAALADQAATPHVEAAVLDGLPAHRVLLHHALPGALPAVATGIATSTGMLLGGAVVVETLFNYPGVGTVLAGAVADRDTPVIAGVVACAAAVITVVLFLADLVRARTLGARP
ncbi:ABC transporter permease [Streptomyces cinnamoneus]|uniref:Metal transporter n=1 Tax=Streptomyces cinnamoneus TaxID=53446 RepID=A0A918TMR0_STRCJ|nr:ABC transporter permease [Streptomyces cinnamoneus]GHC54715.1 metal transporter [Streptomyces cinnamoneus]